MAQTSNSSAGQCAQCGAELPGQSSLKLCPRCLLKAALTGPSEDQTKTAAATPVLSVAGMPGRDELFGHYRIVGLLGGGGMGSVFEADDLETGRRVALKVLSQALDSPEARERFFREGRLAASINHPNSVYIFGTEEIAGTPVISMELISGGTLEAYVRAHGPLPPDEAVDIALQIIAGLEAAQRVGILHRDVKPSNCFRAPDGTIKIGDFGLSISTAVRTEPALTASGAFLGTPAFCSPEQLRGEELSARSDMYSVGATLFYLLTGRTPFEAKNVVALIATVLEQPAPSPRQFRPGIPEGLARIVRRCLEKEPGERFRNYDDLRKGLTPFSSAVPVPGSLPLRFAAGALDLSVQNAVVTSALFVSGVNPLQYLTLMMNEPAKGFSAFLVVAFTSVLYYTILEGCWGATVGKWICRLRVAGPNRGVPGLPRAFVRGLIYVIIPTLPTSAVYSTTTEVFSMSNLTQTLIGLSFYIMLGVLFVTARRRNGFAALHDLASGTRVISKAAVDARLALTAVEAPPANVEKRPMVGPYHVYGELTQSPEHQWLLGFDLRLLRRVWLHIVTPDTPAVPAALRYLSRIGRQRWLTGVRSPTANWDAYEALDGKPLLAMVKEPHPWAQVRFWLFDLAEEIAAAEKDGTLPELKLDRVWITKDGRAKLLDYPCPGNADWTALQSQEPARTGVADSPPVLHSKRLGLDFLTQVAFLALEGQGSRDKRAQAEPQVMLPLEARKVVRALPQLIDAAAAKLALKPLLHRPASVTRTRRAAIVGACAAIPLFATVLAMYGIGLVQNWQKQTPGLLELSQLLQQRNIERLMGRSGPSDESLGIYIAAHYGPLITNNASWHNGLALLMIKGDSRRFAEKSLRDYSAASQQETAAAEAAIKPMLPNVDFFRLLKKPSFVAKVAYAALAVYVAFPAIFAALVFRGGLALRIAGVTFVRKNGAVASRLRVLWRSVVAWSPVAGTGTLFFTLTPEHPMLAAFAPALLLCTLAALSIALPQRGLPDRLAGTWPVPR